MGDGSASTARHHGGRERLAVWGAFALLAVLGLWLFHGSGQPAEGPGSSAHTPADAALAQPEPVAARRAPAASPGLADPSYAESHESPGVGGIEGAGRRNPAVIEAPFAGDAGLALFDEESAKPEAPAHPPEPSKPEPLRRTQRGQDAARLSRLEQRAAAEPRDDDWAANAEREITRAFDGERFGRLDHVRCGTTLCSFVLYGQGSANEDFVRDAVAGIPWQAPVSVRYSQSGALALVMAREGHLLPERE